jgi:hypothetical protein
MKRNVLAVITVIIIAVLVIIFWPRDKEAPVEENQSTTTTSTPLVESNEYSSDLYGYSFTYPSQLEMREYTPDSQVVGELSGDTVEPDAAITIQTSDGLDEDYEGFEDFAVDRLKLMCAADGPHLTINCTEVDSMERFTTSAGLTGTKYYLTQEETNLETSEVASTRRGPFYVFNISANSESDLAALIVHVPIAQPEDQVNESLIDTIVQSIEIEKVE